MQTELQHLLNALELNNLDTASTDFLVKSMQKFHNKSNEDTSILSVQNITTSLYQVLVNQYTTFYILYK